VGNATNLNNWWVDRGKRAVQERPGLFREILSSLVGQPGLSAEFINYSYMALALGDLQTQPIALGLSAKISQIKAPSERILIFENTGAGGFSVSPMARE